MAPEINSQTENLCGYDGSKADIFSLGVLLFTMAFGNTPFIEATNQCMFWRLFKANPIEFFKKHSSTKHNEVSDELK